MNKLPKKMSEKEIDKQIINLILYAIQTGQIKDVQEAIWREGNKIIVAVKREK
jgi:hypothetical protein